MKLSIFLILSILHFSVFSQKIDYINIENNNTQNEIASKKTNDFTISLEGNSDLNLCFGDLKGRIAWISPGITGGEPYNNLIDINSAIENGEIPENPPIIDPNSSGNYYLGPFIYLDNNNCDGVFDGTETLVENINELAAGCYIVYVIDALGNKSEISSISISEPSEIMTLIPIINNECTGNGNGSIEIQINGGTPFNMGEEYFYNWLGPNNFSSNNQNIYQLISGTYSLSVKDSNNCLKNFQFIIQSDTCIVSQTINLQQGWSIISSYINANNNSMESIFNSVVTNLEIVKDENGNVYWPIFGLNSIGNFEIGEGYQVKMNYFDQITIQGNIIPFNTPITFNEGWNLIGYLHPEDGNAIEMMNSIVLNNGPMKILKNSTGDVYWPEFGLNAIGNMSPGEGYHVKLENLTQFSYPSLFARYGKLTTQSKIYFNEPIKTDQNMILGIPLEAWEIDIKVGDEIGVFDSSENLIGSSTFNGNNLAITIWGDDALTESKDGAIENEKFKLKLWHSLNNTEQELLIKWKNGNENYIKDGINIAQSVEKYSYTENKKIISNKDLLGREIKTNKKNQIIFQIHNDGSVIKKYIFN